MNEYESGKAIPNQQVLGKMEKALGIKLRGKDIGSPLEPRGGKKEETPASAAGTKVCDCFGLLCPRVEKSEFIFLGCQLRLNIL